MNDNGAAEICGDIRLSPLDRLRYIIRNACRNVGSLGRGPVSRAFVPNFARAEVIAAGQSPSRLLTELFIESELPQLSAPRDLDVAEIGCGSGSMAYRLARLGYRGRYTGVDIKDRFRRDHPSDFPFKVTYFLGDAHAFAPSRAFDLMISVSALEHIPSDTALISQLPSLFKQGGLEAHVVPSGSSLLTYLWHGYRQYTPATLAQKFGLGIEIVRLGGLGSYLLHFIYITIPELIFGRSLRKTAPRLYSYLLRAALRMDVVSPIMPIAYAVIRRH